MELPQTPIAMQESLKISTMLLRSIEQPFGIGKINHSQPLRERGEPTRISRLPNREHSTNKVHGIEALQQSWATLFCLEPTRRSAVPRANMCGA
jgi:hypothetical protein